MKYQSGKRLAQVKDAILRLVELHGLGITHNKVIDLTVWPSPDGKYLIKGGGPKVWRKFRLRKEHRRLQGIIHGKRCGVTENIGAAAVKRWKKSQQPELLKPACFACRICLEFAQRMSETE